MLEDPDEKRRAYGLPVKEKIRTGWVPVGAAPLSSRPQLTEITENPMTNKTYVTTKDIVIPAGTLVQMAPHKINRFVPYGAAILGVTKDSTAEWTMPIDEALDAGLIEEQVAVPPEKPAA